VGEGEGRVHTKVKEEDILDIRLTIMPTQDEQIRADLGRCMS
jgi:hypothetical protein